MNLTEPLQNLVDALSRLPGIGPKTASRLTFYLLHAQQNLSLELAEALQDLHAKTGYCEVCFNITLAGTPQCGVCLSEERNRAIICVVEDPLDVIALERTGSYQGLYHVLHGVLSPIQGIGPDDIKVAELIKRLRAGGVEEVIVATNPSMEGDATAMYLQQQIEPLHIKVTRLARGLPVGGDLEYADQGTLLRAMLGRQEMG